MLDKLYKRAVTGAIREWSIRVEGSTIIRESGQLGGKMSSKYDTLTSGKNIGRANETTPEEQAESEANSYFLKQKDGGYKTIAEIGGEFTNYGIQVLETDGSLDMMPLAEFLEKYLPKSNTDAQGNVKPMLAKKAEKLKIIFPCTVQPKLDGVRCLMIFRDGDVTFLSRSGKEYTTLKHIREELMPYLDELDGYIFDGEIYSHDFSFQSIVSAVKKEGPLTKFLTFHAYDIVSDEKQYVRLATLSQLLEVMNLKWIERVPDHLVTGYSTIMSLHDDYVKKGYEGAMVRHSLGLYKQGGRSSDLLKVKVFNDGEFTIVGGKIDKVPIHLVDVSDLDDNMIDSFTFTCMCDAGEFQAKPMGTRLRRSEYMADLPNLIGQQATVKHFGWTDDKLPRFGILRAIRDYE